MLRKFTTIVCGSFTVVMLLFMLLSPYDLAPIITNAIALQIFIMSVSISFVMVLAEHLGIDSIVPDVLIKFFICCVIVFFEGAYFGMIRFSWTGFLQLTPALIPAFIITYAIQYITCVEWANKINKSIKRKK